MDARAFVMVGRMPVPAILRSRRCVFAWSRGLDWNDLRDFLAISRHRTLSAAADALGVQQSTMGRRLKALEARVGAKLLQKTPAGFVLTSAGEAILDNVERIE